MEKVSKPGDTRILMLFAYIPTWVNGKFYFWEYYFIKERYFEYFNYFDGNFETWSMVPIHIERWEYEKYKFEN